MSRDLPKTYQCPCGRTKKIKWFDKHDFKKGLIPMVFGFSKCPRKSCEIFQVHLSGDPFAVQSFANSPEYQELQRELHRHYH